MTNLEKKGVTEHVEVGGLWDTDIIDLKTDPDVTDLNVNLEMDGYHLRASYKIRVHCPKCNGTDGITMKINDKHCREYSCEDCDTRWINEIDFNIYTTVSNGPEILEQLHGKQ